MTDIAIRTSSPCDSAELRALAQLDSAEAFAAGADVLIAVVEGRILAALETESMRVIADPFAPTAALVDLLAVRALQIKRPRGARSLLRAVSFRLAGSLG
ncbi:MAG: hypothetical protein NVSMB51_18310 [Solirubrobacteraceae bacterium]